MIYNAYESCLREHMNFRDPETLRFIAEANSTDQNQLLVALTSKLYEKIQEKYDKIDFSTIARSRGDITKIDKFSSLQECIEIINKLVIEYKEDTYPVDVVSSAIYNIQSRTNVFKKAFVIGSPVLTMTYNTICTAIVESVSFLIATCIEYVKVPGNESFRMALNSVAYSRTRENILFESLASFNEGCKSGEFDEACKLCLERTKIAREAAETVDVKHDNPFLTPEQIESDDQEIVVHDTDEKVHTEGLISNVSYVVSRAMMFIMKALIPLIRNIVYWRYSKKQAKADYYEAQAELIQMNAYQLMYNDTIDIDRRKRIYEKQMKIVEKYRARANKYSIDNTMATKSAERLKNSEAREFNVSDFNINRGGEVFDTGNSVLF